MSEHGLDWVIAEQNMNADKRDRLALTDDEITILRYVELCTRPFDMSDPDKEPAYCARKSAHRKGLIAFDRGAILTDAGREALRVSK